ALLGDVPVARHPDEGGDDLSPLVAESFCDGGLDVGDYTSQIGLTSIDPSRAPGIFAATSIASSRSLHSPRYNPPICSLVSAKGPSEVRISPSRTRTVVASVVGRSRSPPCSTPRFPISSRNAMYSLRVADASSALLASMPLSSPQINSAYRMISSSSGQFTATTNGTLSDRQLPASFRTRGRSRIRAELSP